MTIQHKNLRIRMKIALKSQTKNYCRIKIKILMLKKGSLYPQSISPSQLCVQQEVCYQLQAVPCLVRWLVAQILMHLQTTKFKKPRCHLENNHWLNRSSQEQYKVANIVDLVASQVENGTRKLNRYQCNNSKSKMRKKSYQNSNKNFKMSSNWQKSRPNRLSLLTKIKEKILRYSDK